MLSDTLIDGASIEDASGAAAEADAELDVEDVANLLMLSDVLDDIGKDLDDIGDDGGTDDT